MKNFYRRGMLVIIFLLFLAFLFIIFSTQAKASNLHRTNSFYQQQVSGTVRNENGDGLRGVSVLIKNRQYGTITDDDGFYDLQVQPQDTLVFSSLGYKNVEIPVQGRSVVDVVLLEDIAFLGEVMINAGYYNTTRRERTGNISQVKGEEIELQPLASPITALQGRMAGVEITSGGANPGSASTIRIRGINSLRSDGNYPLYIIDGVPLSAIPIKSNSLLNTAGIDPLNNLDPANIKSIEVLKDADATAIYGSRGANGVVLITTKHGTDNGTGFQIRTYTGISKVPGKLELLDTDRYLQLRQLAFENDGVEPDQNNAYDLLLWDNQRYTDWQEYAFGNNAQVNNASLAFSGGSKQTFFRIGGSIFNQGTIYPGDFNYSKITGNVSLDHSSSNKKFHITGSLNYGMDQNNLNGGLNLGALTFLPPNAPSLFNDDGSLNWTDWGQAGLTNPLEGFYNDNDVQTNNLITSTNISYTITDAFSLKSAFGYTRYDSNEFWRLPKRSYNPQGNPINRSAYLSSERDSWIVEPQANYKKDVGKFNLDFLLGATIQESKTYNESFQGAGYASEALIENLAAAEEILNAQSSDVSYRYAAIFFRLGINWDRKYYLNLTGRRDGSSRFGPNNRFANFGAIGSAWIFSEENIIKENLNFLSLGKLRASYGSTGNDQIGDYGYLDAYQATRGSGGLYPTSLSNPNYSWEINKKLELGLELGFLDNRLNLGISWYRNRSSNQLVGYSLPAIAGFTSVQANLPATVENRGTEIEINTINIDHPGFAWQTSLNLSIPKNELVRYDDIDQSSYANVYRVGKPLNISLNYNYTGIDQETGFYAFEDVNGDQRLDFQDRTVVIDRTRQIFGGLNNSLRYHNFSLQFLWQFVKQKGKLTYYNAGRPANILSAYNTEKFQQPTQSYQGGLAYSNALNSSLFMTDGSFLRLKTLALKYDVPAKFIQKIGLKKVEFFFNGQNIWTITSYKGLDPENSFEGSFIGNLQSFTAGLQVNL